VSAAEAYEFQSPLSIAIDFKSPYAYLALQPSLELIDSLGVEVDWLPFDAAPLKPHKRVGPDANRGSRHRWIRAQYQARDLERYAARQGLSIKDVFRAPNTSLAGIGLLWLGQKAPQAIRQYLHDSFAGLWSGDLDMEDEAAVTRVVESAGGSGFAEFCHGDGRLEWDSLQERLIAAGLFDVPTYIVGNELFLGRQHLPMIRKLLEPGL
jgi:2-hydroxychromene-2-carboxylate isomerase